MTDATHSAGCWRWHHDCAIARVEQATGLLSQVHDVRAYEAASWPPLDRAIQALLHTIDTDPDDPRLTEVQG